MDPNLLLVAVAFLLIVSVLSGAVLLYPVSRKLAELLSEEDDND